MKADEFRAQAHRFVDWMADFLESVEDRPVKSPVAPGEVFRQLASQPPAGGELMNRIFEDFQRIILPGMTHWQSPHFFAYFPANSSYPSVLAEMLTATLGAQCMIWETSPAAAELEEMMMNWLRGMLGLPEEMVGVIQDTASTATLCALLSARERVTRFEANAKGLQQAPRLRVYASSQTHSSIEKGVKVAGLGADNYVPIDVDEAFALRPEALEKAIQEDVAQGFQPCCVVATLGTTSSAAMDPLPRIAAICQKYQVWLHVDAAYAGTALILPEMRHLAAGMEAADSFVFNPHKWMFTNFDCTAYFVKDKEQLIRTFSILPEYLKTEADAHVNNYRDWGIPLGRRFRALKLWFVIRTYGLEGIRQKLRTHLALAQAQRERLEAHEDFELMAPPSLNVICFRYHPAAPQKHDALNRLNAQLLKRLNDSGKLYLTHTKLGEHYVIRWVIGQTQVEERHVLRAWSLIQETCRHLQQAASEP